MRRTVWPRAARAWLAWVSVAAVLLATSSFSSCATTQSMRAVTATMASTSSRNLSIALMVVSSSVFIMLAVAGMCLSATVNDSCGGGFAFESKKSIATNFPPAMPSDASCARRSGGTTKRPFEAPVPKPIRENVDVNLLRESTWRWSGESRSRDPPNVARNITGASTSSPCTDSLKYVW